MSKDEEKLVIKPSPRKTRVVENIRTPKKEKATKVTVVSDKTKGKE